MVAWSKVKIQLMIALYFLQQNIHEKSSENKIKIKHTCGMHKSRNRLFFLQQIIHENSSENNNKIRLTCMWHGQK